jgi:hypothetical protein
MLYRSSAKTEDDAPAASDIFLAKAFGHHEALSLADELRLMRE